MDLGQGLFHGCAISVVTWGPMLGLMPYCHYLEILNNFEKWAPCFHLALDHTNYVASCGKEFISNRAIDSVPQWEAPGEGKSGWISSHATEQKCQFPRGAVEKLAVTVNHIL